MNVSKRKIGSFAVVAIVLALVVGLMKVSPSYAEEDTQEVVKIQTVGSTFAEGSEFHSPDYQGKENLKEYWDAVQTYRTDISATREAFEALEPNEEGWAQVDTLIEAAQEETNLEELGAIQEKLNGLLDEWTQEVIAAEQAAADESSYSYSGGSSSYSSGGSGMLTRSGGVNSYGGRTETWYSQKVLPGGGLNIPGRNVASDGTVRDADGYIVVAASDLAYGTKVETSLGTGKVYDTGCAPGVTDVYTDW